MIQPGYPAELTTALGGDKPDFIVKSKRATPAKKALGTLAFGFIWSALTAVFIYAFIGPVFVGKEVHFTSNNVPVVAGPGNLGPLVGPALFLGLFAVIGLAFIGGSVYALVAEGPWIAGTAKRLVVLRKRSSRSIDWEQFTGDISIEGRTGNRSVTLTMRTGRMVSRKNGPDRYVPDIIYISGIEGAEEIERIARQRIKENDPTPAATSVPTGT